MSNRRNSWGRARNSQCIGVHGQEPGCSKSQLQGANGNVKYSYLKTSPGRVALLFLVALGARLASGALTTGRLSFAARHFG